MIRAYTDTSVFGGVFDREFAEPSRLFFAQVRLGRFMLLVSDVNARELLFAPRVVRELFDSLIPYMELIPLKSEFARLRDAYLAAGVLGPARGDDAAHVAAATVGNADIIVSWNFKHLVHVEKVRLFGAVNALNGYRPIDIRSPLEVTNYEKEV